MFTDQYDPTLYVEVPAEEVIIYRRLLRHALSVVRHPDRHSLETRRNLAGMIECILAAEAHDPEAGDADD